MLDIHNFEQANDELMACPFCGERPVWYIKGNPDYINHKRTIVVKCPMCGTRQETSVLKLPTKFGCMEAITKWNLRISKEGNL